MVTLSMSAPRTFAASARILTCSPETLPVLARVLHERRTTMKRSRFTEEQIIAILRSRKLDQQRRTCAASTA